MKVTDRDRGTKTDTERRVKKERRHKGSVLELNKGGQKKDEGILCQLI